MFQGTSLQNMSGWWFGTMEYLMTFHSLGNVIIPIDELIFFRGVAQPPTRCPFMVLTYLHVLDPGIPIDHFFFWDMMGLFDAHMLYV